MRTCIRRHGVLVVALASFMFWPYPNTNVAHAAKPSGPTDLVRQTQSTINSLISRQTAANKRTTDKKLSEAVSRFLDFAELARRSLAKHWEQRSPAEQKEFADILRQLIEKSYLKQMRSNANYSIQYLGEHVTGETASVQTLIKILRNKRSEELRIDYTLHKTTTGWLVYDVVTDDVSILRNYRSQFNRIIQKESYQALVKKMRNKLKSI